MWWMILVGWLCSNLFILPTYLYLGGRRDWFLCKRPCHCREHDWRGATDEPCPNINKGCVIGWSLVVLVWPVSAPFILCAGVIVGVILGACYAGEYAYKRVLYHTFRAIGAVVGFPFRYALRSGIKAREQPKPAKKVKLPKAKVVKHKPSLVSSATAGLPR